MKSIRNIAGNFAKALNRLIYITVSFVFLTLVLSGLSLFVLESDTSTHVLAMLDPSNIDGWEEFHSDKSLFNVGFTIHFPNTPEVITEEARNEKKVIMFTKTDKYVFTIVNYQLNERSDYNSQKTREMLENVTADYKHVEPIKDEFSTYQNSVAYDAIYDISGLHTRLKTFAVLKSIFIFEVQSLETEIEQESIDSVFNKFINGFEVTRYNH